MRCNAGEQALSVSNAPETNIAQAAGEEYHWIRHQLYCLKQIDQDNYAQRIESGEGQAQHRGVSEELGQKGVYDGACLVR
jgi:hypothetical protein